jgi:hypothetical protein
MTGFTLHVRVYTKTPEYWMKKDVWYTWTLVRQEDWPQRVTLGRYANWQSEAPAPR